MTFELSEIQMKGVTSKGSRFRKSVHEYESFDTKNKDNKLIVEINSFANPYPYNQHTIQSMIYDFLKQTSKDELITKFELHPFQIDVLDKTQTLLEKLVSLIRFSFDEDSIESLAKKNRHFYDLYYLMRDAV